MKTEADTVSRINIVLEEGQNGKIKNTKKVLCGFMEGYPNPRRPAI